LLASQVGAVPRHWVLPENPGRLKGVDDEWW
jgi:hypothetical protein